MNSKDVKKRRNTFSPISTVGRTKIMCISYSEGDSDKTQQSFGSVGTEKHRSC